MDKLPDFEPVYIKGSNEKCYVELCHNAAITELDGDLMCKTHADQWVRGEAFMQHNESIEDQ